MSNLITMPAFDELKEEIEKLRTELSMLISQRDELKYVTCKNIEMDYMLKLGALEHKAFQAQCTFLRLKRKLAMIQAKLNRQETIDLAEIEEALDAEFASFREKLDEQIHKMNEALARSQCEALTEAETKELKQRYRRIVKALHPDLNPDVTLNEIELFYRAVEAYENGDLFTLRTIDELVSPDEPEQSQPDAKTALLKRRDQLKELLQTVQQEMEDIKNSFPYTERELLQDEEAVAKRKAELQQLINDYEEAIQVYRERIKEITR